MFIKPLHAISVVVEGFQKRMKRLPQDFYHIIMRGLSTCIVSSVLLHQVLLQTYFLYANQSDEKSLEIL